ncbi:MAG: MarR family transcriptional regulator [Chloroflexi bacterium]|nr:MarR family transcriptional regulator [Chloroflexota bacterium]
MLGTVGHTIGSHHDMVLKNHKLSAAKLGVLRQLILAGEPLPLGQLAARLTCVRSNITQLVDRLEQDGFVKRLPDSDDRRCLRAAITEEGRRRYAAGVKAQVEVQRQWLENLSAQEQAELATLLAKLRKTKL